MNKKTSQNTYHYDLQSDRILNLFGGVNTVGMLLLFKHTIHNGFQTFKSEINSQDTEYASDKEYRNVQGFIGIT